MEPLTIFYSWQSDLPNSTNRSFIEQALKTAVRDLNKGDAVLMDLVVDRDTQNTHGAKHIADSILDKIQRAAIFVCDISFINSESSNPEGQNRPRLTPNPNVLIELGYALHVLGYDRILLVFNTAFGKVDDLPFDIRFRRVIQYTSHETDSDRASQRKKLTDDFKSNLPAMLKNVETIRHTNMQELLDKATEFHNQRVAFINQGEDHLQVNGIKPFLLLHTIPLENLKGETIINITHEQVFEQQYQIVHPFMTYAKFARIVRQGYEYTIVPTMPEEVNGEYRRSYVQIFRDGVIEFADVFLLSPWNNSDPKKGLRFPSTDVSVIKAIRRALRFYQQENVDASIAIFLTLCNGKGLSVLREDKGDILVGHQLTSNDPLTFKGAVIESIAAPEYLYTAFKPIMDELYRCFGFPSAFGYLEDGSLNPEIVRRSSER